MGDFFWLSDEAWAAIEPHMPKNQPGARRVDDRRVDQRHRACSQDGLPVAGLSA
jgi:transposase